MRRRKKVRKLRGSRTHGFGRVGQHRKGGMTGGKGKSGYKHKRMLYNSNGKYFGSHGFQRPLKIRSKVRTINVGQLDELADRLIENSIAEKENNKIIIDVSKLGFDKVLGEGIISKPLVVKANAFSKKAEEKLEKSGGQALIIE